MGAVIRFRQKDRDLRPVDQSKQSCEVIIFPGVRIERQNLDLSHRVRRTAGRTDFDSLGGNGRPRKSS